MATNLLLTGATSGIGRFLAHHFASRGFRLFLHGRDEQQLDHLSKSLKAANLTILKADLESLRDIEQMFSELVRHTKVLDVVVNNAFGKLEDRLSEAAAVEIQKFFQVSLAGTALIVQKCIPLLRKSKSPHIMNIVADWGFPMHNIMTGPALYVAGKYGVHGLGAALQMELGAFGIRTTNICPGIVAAETPFEGTYDDFKKKQGLKAIHPEAIAGAIDFILSQRSAHVRSIILSPRDPKYNGL